MSTKKEPKKQLKLYLRKDPEFDNLSFPQKILRLFGAGPADDEDWMYDPKYAIHPRSKVGYAYIKHRRLERMKDRNPEAGSFVFTPRGGGLDFQSTGGRGFPSAGDRVFPSAGGGGFSSAGGRGFPIAGGRGFPSAGGTGFGGSGGGSSRRSSAPGTQANSSSRRSRAPSTQASSFAGSWQNGGEADPAGDHVRGLETTAEFPPTIRRPRGSRRSRRH